MHFALRGRELLAKQFPLAFAPKGAPKRPLKIGITKDIVDRLPDVKKYFIAAAIHDYCSGPSYYAACTPNAPRYDLDGNPCGAVTADQAEHAATVFATFPKEVRSLWGSQVPGEPKLGPARNDLLAGCTGKVAHETPALAHKINQRRANGGKVYKCEVCGKFHLGTLRQCA